MKITIVPNYQVILFYQTVEQNYEFKPLDQTIKPI
jgi:hypothetical protein